MSSARRDILVDFVGVDDALARVNVKSDTADLMLFDGRDRAHNGWFALRSLIPSGKMTGAIVWHIRPDVIPNGTRPYGGCEIWRSEDGRRRP